MIFYSKGEIIRLDRLNNIKRNKKFFEFKSINETGNKKLTEYIKK
jgi:hypothetical protein